MFEKFRQFLDESKSMLEDAFVIPDDDDFVAVPPDVTEEQLIEESKQYVDAIIVKTHHDHHHNLVGVELDDDAKNDQDQNPDPAPGEPAGNGESNTTNDTNDLQ